MWSTNKTRNSTNRKNEQTNYVALDHWNNQKSKYVFDLFSTFKCFFIFLFLVFVSEFSNVETIDRKKIVYFFHPVLIFIVSKSSTRCFFSYCCVFFFHSLIKRIICSNTMLHCEWSVFPSLMTQINFAIAMTTHTLQHIIHSTTIFVSFFYKFSYCSMIIWSFILTQSAFNSFETSKGQYVLPSLDFHVYIKKQKSISKNTLQICEKSGKFIMNWRFRTKSQWEFQARKFI